MRVVDTSVWIDFWRGSRTALDLADLLEAGEVLLHSWVLGELALGGLGPKRGAILRDLRLLPAAPLATDVEVLGVVDRYSLSGSGLGWVDVQLLASAKLASAELWTNDRRLMRAWQAIH